MENYERKVWTIDKEKWHDMRMDNLYRNAQLIFLDFLFAAVMFFVLRSITIEESQFIVTIVIFAAMCMFGLMYITMLGRYLKKLFKYSRAWILDEGKLYIASWSNKKLENRLPVKSDSLLNEVSPKIVFWFINKLVDYMADLKEELRYDSVSLDIKEVTNVKVLYETSDYMNIEFTIHTTEKDKTETFTIYDLYNDGMFLVRQICRLYEIDWENKTRNIIARNQNFM